MSHPIVAPSISASPVSQTLLSEETASFTCVAPGDPTPTVTWLTTNSVNVLLLGDTRIQVSVLALSALILSIYSPPSESSHLSPLSSLTPPSFTPPLSFSSLLS